MQVFCHLGPLFSPGAFAALTRELPPQPQPPGRQDQGKTGDDPKSGQGHREVRLVQVFRLEQGRGADGDERRATHEPEDSSEKPAPRRDRCRAGPDHKPGQAVSRHAVVGAGVAPDGDQAGHAHQPRGNRAQESRRAQQRGAYHQDNQAAGPGQHELDGPAVGQGGSGDRGIGTFVRDEQPGGYVDGDPDAAEERQGYQCPPRRQHAYPDHVGQRRGCAGQDAAAPGAVEPGPSLTGDHRPPAAGRPPGPLGGGLGRARRRR